MKVSIQYSNKKQEFEGEACVIGISDAEDLSGVILGTSPGCLISLLGLIRKFLKECTLYDKIIFMKIMKSIMDETEEKAC